MFTVDLKSLWSKRPFDSSKTCETSLSHILHIFVILVPDSDLLMSACLMKRVTFLNRLGLDPEETGQRCLLQRLHTAAAMLHADSERRINLCRTHKCTATAEEWWWWISVITGRRDETGRGGKERKGAVCHLLYPLICYPVSLFLFSFLSLYFWATQLFFVFSVHLLSSPVKSSLFSHCCFLCTRPPPSVFGSLALLGLTLCHAGGRSVSGCQLAGKLRDLKKEKKKRLD